jgi:hypothetical protein
MHQDSEPKISTGMRVVINFDALTQAGTTTTTTTTTAAVIIIVIITIIIVTTIIIPIHDPKQE